jgi:hypothetical protein
MDDTYQETWDTGRLLWYENDSAANTETVRDPIHIHHVDMFHIYAETSNDFTPLDIRYTWDWVLQSWSWQITIYKSWELMAVTPSLILFWL